MAEAQPNVSKPRPISSDTIYNITVYYQLLNYLLLFIWIYQLAYGGDGDGDKEKEEEDNDEDDNSDNEAFVKSPIHS